MEGIVSGRFVRGRSSTRAALLFSQRAPGVTRSGGMSKAWWIGGMAALWAGAAGLGACSSTACDDLATICDQCTDTVYKNACKNVVNQGTTSLCNQSRAVYTTYCPAPPPSSSSTSSSVAAGSGSGGATSASTSSTASGGGASSASATGAGGAGGK
jgi:hypothetical protein